MAYNPNHHPDMVCPPESRPEFYERGRKGFEGVAHCIRFEYLMNIIWDDECLDREDVKSFFGLEDGRHKHLSANAIKVARLIGFNPVMDWDHGHCVVEFPDGTSCVLEVHGGSLETVFP